MKLLFSLALFFCFYTYVLYPVLIALYAKLCKPSMVVTPEDIKWPSVSVVIAAHNEAATIEIKINNTRELEYAGPKIQIVVVSDGSDDGTNEYLSSQKDIIFHSYDGAKGKPTALNLGVKFATGEIVIFMDARQIVSKQAVTALVLRFQDASIGAVSGELMLVSESGESQNIGLYWRYEKWIRNNESKVYSTAGATGALYAIRRADYQSLPVDTLLDDFNTPINILKLAKRTVFESEAMAFDKTSVSVSDEFKRKCRTLAGNYQSFERNAWLFNPLKNPIFIQFISHKVFRLVVPYAMLLMFVTSLLSDDLMMRMMLLAQLIFYVSGILAFTVTSLEKVKILNFIKVFLQLNYAAVFGLYLYMNKQSAITWKSKV